MSDYRHWQVKQDAQGVVWLSLDKSDASVNTLNRDVLEEFDKLLDEFGHQPNRQDLF